MVFVALQVGQCGNQLGRELFDVALRESSEDELARFFRAEASGAGVLPVARAVLVDMEAKVIQSILARDTSARFAFSKAGALWQQGGAGNNWALGYEVMGPESAERALECVRREFELADRVDCLAVMHSVSGGTGSGVGSYLCERIADELAPGFLLSVAVLPFEHGDVAVQAYNACLTLSSTLSVVDGMCVYSNDLAAVVCRDALHERQPSFSSINRVLAKSLASVLLPSRTPGAAGAECGAGEILGHLCSHPTLKLFSTWSVPQLPASSVPFDVQSWSALNSLAHRMCATGRACEIVVPRPPAQYAPLLSTWFVYRGLAPAHGPPAGATTSSSGSGSGNTLRFAPWSAGFRYSWAPRPFCGYPLSLGVATNCATWVQPFARLAERSRTMLAQRAFLHNFVQYGVDDERLRDAVMNTEHVFASYRSAAS
jgi:tubulin delta